MADSSQHRLFTIGHSTHSVEALLDMLQRHDITAVADVRSSPYSQYNYQFNRESFQADLKKVGIQYVYLGSKLGPRSDDPCCWENGKASYKRIAETSAFQEGLNRLRKGLGTYRIALLCAEKDPTGCHRMILVCRHIRGRYPDIQHIREDGTLEAHAAAENRLLKLFDLTPGGDLLNSHEELLEIAYDKQGDKIAYSEDETAEQSKEQENKSGIQNGFKA